MPAFYFIATSKQSQGLKLWTEVPVRLHWDTRIYALHKNKSLELSLANADIG
jgi:hypothetical protein